MLRQPRWIFAPHAEHVGDYAHGLEMQAFFAASVASEKLQDLGNLRACQKTSAMSDFSIGLRRTKLLLKKLRSQSDLSLNGS